MAFTDTSCFCSTCNEYVRYPFAPHWKKNEQLCVGHPRILDPINEDCATWEEYEAKHAEANDNESEARDEKAVEDYHKILDKEAMQKAYEEDDEFFPKIKE